MVSVIKKSLFHKKNGKGNTSIDNVILNCVFSACETFLTKPNSKEVEKSSTSFEGTGWGEVFWEGCAPYSPWKFLALQQEGSHIKARKMFFCPCSYPPMACPTYNAYFSPAHYLLWCFTQQDSHRMCANRVLYPVRVNDCTVFKKVKNESCFPRLEHILE